MARAVIGTLIAPVLVASPGPCLRIPRVGALTLCDVASTSGANTSFRVSCESRWRLGPVRTNPPATPVAQGAAGPSPQKPISSTQEDSATRPQAWQRKPTAEAILRRVIGKSLSCESGRLLVLRTAYDGLAYPPPHTRISSSTWSAARRRQNAQSPRRRVAENAKYPTNGPTRWSHSVPCRQVRRCWCGERYRPWQASSSIYWA
jgi:hypothetical protein